MMQDISLDNDPVEDLMSVAETIESRAPLLLPGQTSPRSPLECDYDPAKPSTNAIKKKVVFSPSVAVSQIPAPVGSPQQLQQQKPQKQARRRKVAFAARVLYKEIRHINDYSDEEIEMLWLTVKDHQLIKAMVKTTVLMMMRGEHISEEDEDFCTRGLEFRTKAGSRIRSKNKLRARAAVLNEQDMQREEGFSDPEYLAMASMEASAECRDGAEKRAQHDAKCIELYLEDVRMGFRCFNLGS